MLLLKAAPGRPARRPLPHWHRSWVHDAWSLAIPGASTGSRRPGTFIYKPPSKADTLVIADDSPEPALIFFVVEGGLIYLDKGTNGAFAAYEDGFTLLELTRELLW